MCNSNTEHQGEQRLVSVIESDKFIVHSDVVILLRADWQVVDCV
jgi:hypothetical protein